MCTTGCLRGRKKTETVRDVRRKVFSQLKIMILILCIAKQQELFQIRQIRKEHAVTFSWFLSDFSANPRRLSFPGCTDRPFRVPGLVTCH